MNYKVDLWLGRRFRRTVLRYGDVIVLTTLLGVVGGVIVLVRM